MTGQHSRLTFARVCVELDAKVAPIHQLDVLCPLSPDPIPIRVEYEWKPKHCPKCCVFGHVCPKKKEMGCSVGLVAKSVSATGTVRSSDPPCVESDIATGGAPSSYVVELSLVVGSSHDVGISGPTVGISFG